MVGLWESGWERMEKLVGKWSFTHLNTFVANCTQFFTRKMHEYLHGDLHGFSTLTINTLLDFFDLVTQDEVKFEVFLDFFDAVHNGGVVFNADFGGDFGGTEAEVVL